MVGLAQWALMSGGAGKVAILRLYHMPFWVVVMAALFLGERHAAMAVYRHRGGMRGPDTRTSALATRLYLPEKRLAGDPPGVSSGQVRSSRSVCHTRYPQVDLLALTTWQMLYAAVVMSVVAGGSSRNGR